MTDEGYIKFNLKSVGTNIIPENKLLEINKYRKKLYDLGLIGMYTKGKNKNIGFGNISIKTKKGFIISGSATGGIANLTSQHYSKVLFVNLDKNYLEYNGPIKASSESMTHATIYKSDPNINAIIHIHNLELWQKILNKVPTTRENAAYGTPEMAYEMKRLFKETNVKNKKIIAAAGHKEGIFTFGINLVEAFSLIQKIYN